MKEFEPNKTFSIVTFGCKLNQFESELIREAFIRDGWFEREFNDGADVFIVNTCTVTGKSDARGRNAVRRAKRIRPDARIIVTGCYAETQPEALRSMEEVDLVIGNDGKGLIHRLADSILKGAPIDKVIEKAESWNAPMMIESFFEHSRAFIKIQEGCNSACSYCIIPRARGRSRSVDSGQVLKQVELLKEKGYREVVLTGIHIGRYGRDLGGKIGLSDLVEMILDRVSDLRIRLSSIEVNEIDKKLLRLMKGSKFFASHLHIPMQSGDDEVLKSMRRPYTSCMFVDKILEVRESVPNVAIGSDVIVGFPGEEERHFENTYKLASTLPINYFHVFSYSPRPGTAAADFTNHVSPDEKKRRSKKLRKLSRRKRNEFIRSQVGVEHEVLIQGPKSSSSRFMRSLTGNYCEVYLKCDDGYRGKLVPVLVNYYSKGRLYGTLISSSEEGTAGATVEI